MSVVADAALVYVVTAVGALSSESGTARLLTLTSARYESTSDAFC